ncbi:MAG: urease accessory protein UreE [Herminiimonas sp.]|nr:urease accessory protein UreE [Herminiimonas sp.]
MLTLNTKLEHAAVIDGELILPYALREKSRQRAVLASGEEVAVFTLRGTVMRDGDLLQGSEPDGTLRVVRVVAAAEETYRVACTTPQALLRCAFHLGNRHTQAQVGQDAEGGFLRIRRDPVLQDMLTGLGARVTPENAPFEPESGAYGGGHHGHDGQDGGHGGHLLAPVPLRQKIHRPSDPT